MIRSVIYDFIFEYICEMETNSKQKYFKGMTPDKNENQKPNKPKPEIFCFFLIWHAHDTIDQKQDNKGNSIPVVDIFNFFTFLDDRTLCLSFFVQITCEIEHEESYCLNEELD